MSDITRRELLQGTAAVGMAAAVPASAAPRATRPGVRMTGAQALASALLRHQVTTVFGIPGAQSLEFWDEMKTQGIHYVLVTNEFSASIMADAYARCTGRVGAIDLVPGPGLTNALTGIGEALLDSIPMLAIVTGVSIGPPRPAFQVHDLDHLHLLRPVTKDVIQVADPRQIPTAVDRAIQVARSGEPGPVGLIVPYNLLTASAAMTDEPAPAAAAEPLDLPAFARAVELLRPGQRQVGIYAGLGCMDYSAALRAAAEMLQAPIATSVSGKGCVDERHPLAVGYGYGPYGTRTAEMVFCGVDVVLAIGVRYSEVSTANYSIPPHDHLIQVDRNPRNLGRVVKPTVTVHGDAGVFLDHLLSRRAVLERPANPGLRQTIAKLKRQERAWYQRPSGTTAVDPLAFILELRRALDDSALVFVDVCMAEHLANEAFEVRQPRTYFNPMGNQAMGWSIPAAVAGQRAHPGRQAVTITGDGCFLMSALECSTAARDHLPVKFFILDDGAYSYMQELQRPAYRRTTATLLARLEFAALARGMGLHYTEILSNRDLAAQVRATLETPGPVLTRVVADYRGREIRWIDALKTTAMQKMPYDQRLRFLARIGSRIKGDAPDND